MAYCYVPGDPCGSTASAPPVSSDCASGVNIHVYPSTQPPPYQPCGYVPPPPPAYSQQQQHHHHHHHPPHYQPPPQHYYPPAPHGGYHAPCKTSTGLFGDIGRGLDNLARGIENTLDRVVMGDVVNIAFRTNCVIQIVKPDMGALQIVTGPMGTLMLDINGQIGHHHYNAQWMVYREPHFSDIVRLYNQNNYLAVEHGVLTLIPAASPALAPMCTRFRVRQSAKMISLESMHCPCHYLAVDQCTRQVRAMEVSTLSNESYFSIYHVK